VAPLHDRMPVILADPDAETAWLDAAAPVAQLGLPFGALAVREVSRAVNDARHDGPDVLEPPDQLALI
jgi:putative SOS response-associated peptidase YedK